MKNPFQTFLKSILIVLIFFYSCNSFSQEQAKIDSLKQVLTTAKQDTNKVKTLNSLAVEYQRINLDTSLIYAEQALKQSTKLSYKKGMADSYNKIGAVHYYHSDYTLALKNWEEQLKISKEIGDKKGMAGCYNNIGLIHSKQGSYDQAIEYYLKSLKINEELGDKKGMAGCYNNIGLVHKDQGSYNKAIEYYLKSLKIKEEIGDKHGMSKCYNNIGIVYKDQGSYDKAISYYLKSLKIKEELGNKKGMSNTYNNIGDIYSDKGSYDKAITYFLKSLKILRDIDDKYAMSACYIGIGYVHVMQGSYDKAIEYFLKSLKILKEIGNKHGMSYCYNNIGNVYLKQGSYAKDQKVKADKYNKAIEYYLKSLKILKEIDDNNGIASSYNNIGIVYYYQGSYNKAIEYYLKSLKIYEELNDKNRIVLTYNNIAELNITLADSVALTENQRHNYLNKAVSYSNNAIELAKEIKAMPRENTAANMLMKAYKKLENYKKALKFAEIFISTQDSMFNKEKTKAITEMETKYETEKKQQQIELQETQIAKKDIEIKQQKTHRNALMGGLGAFVIIIILVVYAYVQKKKDYRIITKQKENILSANEELKTQNEEILAQRDEIEAQRDEIEAQRDHVINQKEEITDSINYAKRIQSAILPPETYITELLHENFIFYKPRDIVSGDFYWIKQINQFVVLVAADCTGHGVPGAFMSMLGISYLNEIVQRREITQANMVLNELRSQIKHSLRQHGQRDETKDGMDIALCVIDTKNKMMQYAGAFNPLYLIRDVNDEPELKEIKADRMPVGFYHGKDKSFTNHEIQLEMGDTFYIFSDGFIDQNGGKDNKKYMSKNFKNLLLEIHEQPMYEQKEILDKTLKDWMDVYPQMDDILVIGVRV